MSPKMSPALAQIELAVLSSEADAVSSADMFAWLKSHGLPDEVAIRLKEVANLTGRVGARLVKVGKIVLIKIIEFVKAHPGMAIGIAIGAVVGALGGAIPVLGPILVPLGVALGVTIGGVAGHAVDMGRRYENDALAHLQDAIEMAKVILAKVIETFNQLLNEGCFEPI